MKTIYDLQQLLKKFGTYIYTGDRIGDLELMSLELKELYDNQFINGETYTVSMLLIRKELREYKNRT